MDADNAGLDSLDHVTGALAGQGEVTIRRAYGNWFKASLRTWDSELSRHGFRAVQQSDPIKGKNATDLALMIDAVELYHTIRPDVFALVSSDSDHTTVAHFLRKPGARVLGFEPPTSARSFQAPCTAFTPVLSVTGTAEKAEPTPQKEPTREPTLSEQLADAIIRNADKQGWAR